MSFCWILKIKHYVYYLLTLNIDKLFTYTIEYSEKKPIQYKRKYRKSEIADIPNDIMTSFESNSLI